ncbi:MAG: glycosyltransferase family 39 protein [Candidatus Coatesbacteria bacterium]|nr:MAG: glycosyltransferase family 39 protein [Candidatus Coatesbacteria bacterium]
MRAAAAFRNYLRTAGGGPFLAATAALFALGVALRLGHLFDVVRLDEATTYVRFASRPFGEALSSYHLPNNHLLNTLLVKLSVSAFGPEPWALRLPNFVAGLGAMALVAAIAGRWFGRAGAVGALAAAAIALPVVHYSVLARGYGLALLFCLLALWSIERRHAGGGRGWTVVAAASCALALYAVAAALLLVLPLAAYDFILARGEGRRALAFRAAAWLGAAALAALLYLPVMLHHGPAQLLANEYAARLGPGRMGPYLQAYNYALRDEKTWAAGGARLWAPVVFFGVVAAAFKNKRVGLFFALCALIYAAFFKARFPLPTRVLHYGGTLAALAVGGLAGAAAELIWRECRGSAKVAWAAAASIVALTAAVGAVGESKNLIANSLRSGSARKARSVAAAIAELPPVTRIIVGGWYHDTVKYYLMIDGFPAEAIDRNPPRAFTFEAYVLVPPGSNAQWETDRYFQYGPMPIVRCERAADGGGFAVWKAIVVNPL